LDAARLAGVAVPLAQLSMTVTEAPLSGTKFFFTVNELTISVFVISQDPDARAAAHVPVLV
jgi:hypothetical protein